MYTEIGLLRSHSVVVSTLDMLSGDLGLIPGGRTSGEILFKQAPLAAGCKPATWLHRSILIRSSNVLNTQKERSFVLQGTFTKYHCLCLCMEWDLFKC